MVVGISRGWLRVFVRKDPRADGGTECCFRRLFAPLETPSGARGYRVPLGLPQPADVAPARLKNRKTISAGKILSYDLSEAWAEIPGPVGTDHFGVKKISRLI